MGNNRIIKELRTIGCYDKNECDGTTTHVGSIREEDYRSTGKT